MQNLKRWSLALVASLLVAVPVLASFDITSLLREPTVFGVTVGADDDSAVLLIRSFHAGGGSFTVGAGALTFYQSEVGATTAEDEFECPVSGALGGIIDTTNASCNTLGEIADIINASTSWRAVIIDGTRSTALTSTGLLAVAQANSNVAEGVAVYADSSAQVESFRAALPGNFRTDIRNYLVGDSTTLVENPFLGTQTVLFPQTQKSSFSSGTANFYVDSVLLDLDSGSETLQTIWTEVTAATTVWKTYEFGAGYLLGPQNYKLVVRTDDGGGTVGTFRHAGTGAFGEFRR